MHFRFFLTLFQNMQYNQEYTHKKIIFLLQSE